MSNKRAPVRLVADVLGEDRRTVIVQDDLPVDVASLRGSAARLRDRLEPFRGLRVALMSPRADRSAAALLAAHEVDCELLLLTRQYEIDDPLLERWSVSGVIGADLDLTETGRRTLDRRGPAILLGSSGTGGAEPKIARHSIDSLLGRIRVPDPRKAGAPPCWLLTYHPASFAGLQVLLTAVLGNGKLIALSDPAVPALAEALEAHEATHISGTPTFFRSLALTLSGRSAPSSVRQITLGGEAVDQTTLDLLRRVFEGVSLTHIYASTEAGALFAVRDGRAGFPARWLDEAVDDVRLRIVDGMLEVQSPRAMTGYVSVDIPVPFGEGGWLATGDLVERVGDRVFFRGRADSVINVGGAKVQPEKVEAALLKLSGVHEARVFGQPNPITGAIVVAEIVVADVSDEAALRKVIADHGAVALAPHERPRIVRVVDRIEVNVSGKKGRSPSCPKPQSRS